MPEKTMTLADLEDLDLAELDVSDLTEVHVVRDAVAVPETGASWATPASCSSCSCSYARPV